jgi:hypothetical protein
MPFYYRAKCRNVEDAIQAFHSTGNVFDDVEDVSSIAKKRSGRDVLFRFDDSEVVAAKCLAALRVSGLFKRIDPTDSVDFESSRSNAV